MSFHLSPFSWQGQGEAKLALGKTHHDLSPKTGPLRRAELWHWVLWSRDPAPTATTLRSSSGDAWVCVTRGRQPKAQACSCRSSVPWKSPRWIIQATKQWSQVPKGEDQAAKHAVANIPGLLTKAARAGERSGPTRAAIQLRAVPRGTGRRCSPERLSCGRLSGAMFLGSRVQAGEHRRRSLADPSLRSQA